jgi:hypothetical protein
MEVTVQIALAPDERPDLTTDQAAEAILTALGGDPASDYVVVNAHRPSVTGEAGTKSQV